MFAALKRLNIYQKEMYPIISRLLLGYLVFGEIYFIILLNHGIIDVKFGIQELVCGFTVFSFLFWLATVYKGNIIKNLIMDCQSYTKYHPNETTGGIFVSWRRKEEFPTGA